MEVFLMYVADTKQKLIPLSKFSSSLVELDFFGDDWLETNLPANMSFPKLETLSASPISASVALKFIKDATKLKRLSIDFCEPDESDEEFAEMLLKKTTLKELTLKNVLVDFFFDSFRTPEFKLTSLAIECYQFDLIANINFNAFVLAMADTLTSLFLYYFRAEDTLLIQNLPALKTLKIGEHVGASSLASYKSNTSIEVLGFKHVNTTPPAFLKSLKSVRSMNINRIDEDGFKKTLENCPGLLKLEIGSACGMEQEDFEDIYKEVRSVEPSSVESLNVMVAGKQPFDLKL
jgi:hypothetical protein